MLRSETLTDAAQHVDMSLIGIDVGTSAIKAAAYAVDGTPLAVERRDVSLQRPAFGHEEVSVIESREAFLDSLASLVADPHVRRDPPVAVALSASGREVFPVAADGTPLGPCLMTADRRGDDVAAQTAARHTPEEWFRLAGHLPQRMDPVNRALWWRRAEPETARQARWFMNWHEYYAMLLSGRPVADFSGAGAWATFDLQARSWSPERVAETGIDPSWLPEVQASGTPIGRILPAVARRLALPEETLIVAGAFDTFAASIGTGAAGTEVTALACGTWHTFSQAVPQHWHHDLADPAVSLLPHPGPSGLALLVPRPSGMKLIDRARERVHLSTTDLSAGLSEAGPEPSALLTGGGLDLAQLSAALRSATIPDGETFVTSGIELVRALLELVACDFALALDGLARYGLRSNLVRVSGGGARMPWWLQLHADVCGRPVEVTTQDEPGAFGAALLAGVGAGVYPSVTAAAIERVHVSRRYEPDLDRGALYAPVRDLISSLQAE